MTERRQSNREGNRRFTNRFQSHLKLKLYLSDEPLETTVSNLSVGGICIRTTLRPTIGTRLRLELTIPGQNELFSAEGEVKWSDEAHVGVQFIGLRAMQVWQLNRYLLNLPPH